MDLQRHGVRLWPCDVDPDSDPDSQVLANTVNGTTYVGIRARTTGAPQNHWFGPSGDPRGAGEGLELDRNLDPIPSPNPNRRPHVAKRSSEGADESIEDQARLQTCWARASTGPSAPITSAREVELNGRRMFRSSWTRLLQRDSDWGRWGSLGLQRSSDK